MGDALLMIVFVALVAGAAEFVRARCRRQLLATIAVAHRTAAAAAEPAPEPVSS